MLSSACPQWAEAPDQSDNCKASTISRNPKAASGLQSPSEPVLVLITHHKVGLDCFPQGPGMGPANPFSRMDLVGPPSPQTALEQDDLQKPMETQPHCRGWQSPKMAISQDLSSPSFPERVAP